MKTIKLSLLAFGFLCLLLFMSCSNDDDSSSNNNVQNDIESHVQSGTWRISNFVDSGADETSDFTGYNFTFESSGILNANNGSNDFNGTWSVTNNDSNDDSPDDNDLDFNINFNLTNDFEDLNDDWDIVSQSANKIELTDVSGGNGGTDFLTFEKN